MLNTGVQMQPMPRPLSMRPGAKSQRPELVCAAQSMYPLPAARTSRPGIRRYLPLIFWTRPLAMPDETIIAIGWSAIVSPASIALSPSTDCR